MSPPLSVVRAHQLIVYQVVRYTALLGGVFYGIVHRRSLQKAHDAEVKHHAIHQREHLIEEAKAAFKRKQESGKDGGECSFCKP